ncbi:MAG: hypothetical protein KGQ93_11085 [Cyanobacteria bacterium REEB459]|nr:hypothetical protein [Cyanobacteria bacterium REEB459]
MALKLKSLFLASLGRWAAVCQPSITGWLVVGCVVLVGCGRSPSPSPPTAPTTSPAATPPPAVAPAPTPTPPLSAPVTPPTPAAPQSVTPPSRPAAPAGARLPEALIKQWEPMSNVLVAFGPLTLKAEAIEWGGGQSTPYSLISQEDGWVLKLETAPKFYDTAYSYIKLIPKPGGGTPTGVDVAFYENTAQLKSNQYTMYGSYFLK